MKPLVHCARAAAIGGAALLAYTAAPTPSSAVSGAAAGYDPDAVLVAFHDSARMPARLSAVQRLGLTVDSRVSSPHFARLRLGSLRSRGVTVASVIDALRRDPSVRVAEPDAVVRVDGVVRPKDLFFKVQWGLDNTGQEFGTKDADIDMPEAWRAATGSPNVIVAIPDSGIDFNHPDLSPNILRDGSNNVVGFDFLDADPNPISSTEPHGTFVAGIIGAVGMSPAKTGIAGVTWAVKMMPLRFIGNDGLGLTSKGILCIDFARLNGAHIINNSWGNYNGPASNLLLKEAIQRAETAGILVVCSAGNENLDTDLPDNLHHPSGFNTELTNVLSVGATDRNDAPAHSNFGATSIDLAAPGEDIHGTLPAGAGPAQYGVGDGTSNAAAFVTGVAALIRGLQPGITAADLKARILNNVDVKGGLAGKNATSGRLNANLAVFNGDPPGGLLKVKSLKFKNAVKVGESDTTDLVITNGDKETDLRITGVGPITGPFSLVSGGPVTIPPGGKSSMTLRFTPTAPLKFDGTLTLTTRDPTNATAVVNISGKGKR